MPGISSFDLQYYNKNVAITLTSEVIVILFKSDLMHIVFLGFFQSVTICTF